MVNQKKVHLKLAGFLIRAAYNVSGRAVPENRLPIASTDTTERGAHEFQTAVQVVTALGQCF